MPQTGSCGVVVISRVSIGLFSPFGSGWCEASQAKRVRDDTDAGECHGARRQGGREEPAGEREERAGRHRDQDQVVAEGPDEVLADGAHGGAREADRGGGPSAGRRRPG